MFNLDPGKLLIIAVVAVILLGPDKLPQVARQAGGAWKTFNEFRHRMESEVRGSIPDLPSSAEIAHLARSPTALLNRLSEMGGPEAKAAEADSAHGALPDGAPIEPFAVPDPAQGATNGNGHDDTRTSSPSDPVEVAGFADPNLN
jgi:sec-independent protein translocase protein TatB